MISNGNKRQARQALSPDEVRELLLLKKLRQNFIIEKFKKSRWFKLLNTINIIYMTIFTEIIFSFLGPVNYYTYYIENVKVYYGEEIINGKRIVGRAEFKTMNGKDYEVSVNDHCEIPKIGEKILVGRDWLLQKNIKVNFESTPKAYFIRRSFPLLFISLLSGILTCVLFAYNLNQNAYSLNALSFINSLSVFAFLLL